VSTGKDGERLDLLESKKQGRRLEVVWGGKKVAVVRKVKRVYRGSVRKNKSEGGKGGWGEKEHLVTERRKG